jgi:hypothetical protein
MSDVRRSLTGTPAFPQIGAFLSAAPKLDVRPGSTQARPVRLGKLQGDREQLAANAQLVDVVLDIDCSGSEYFYNNYGPYCSGGDPTGIRMACGRSLLRLMRDTGGGSMGIIYWGSRPVVALPPTDVRTGFKEIDKVLQADPGNMGGNDFPAALDAARAQLVGESPERIQLVFGITDGLEDITPAMKAAVAALPAQAVHVLLVPGEACNANLAAQWQAMPLGGFTRLPTDNRALAHTIGSIYAEAIGGELPKFRSNMFTRRNTR